MDFIFVCFFAGIIGDFFSPKLFVIYGNIIGDLSWELLVIFHQNYVWFSLILVGLSQELYSRWLSLELFVIVFAGNINVITAIINTFSPELLVTYFTRIMGDFLWNYQWFFNLWSLPSYYNFILSSPGWYLIIYHRPLNLNLLTLCLLQDDIILWTRAPVWFFIILQVLTGSRCLELSYLLPNESLTPSLLITAWYHHYHQ